MKKVFLFGALTLMVLSSCKKDWTCTCKGDQQGTIVLPIQKQKKSDAESTCSSAETVYKNNDATTTCTLEKK